MPAINIYIGERDLTDEAVGRAQTQNKDGQWVKARPVGFNSWAHTMRCIVAILKGKADIVIWKQ